MHITLVVFFSILIAIVISMPMILVTPTLSSQFAFGFRNTPISNTPIDSVGFYCNPLYNPKCY
jgi:hypothetical protein